MRIDELLYHIVSNIIDDSCKLSVSQIVGSTTNIIDIKVPKDQVGKIIGKDGIIIKSIRNIVYSASFKLGDKKRYIVDVSEI